MSYCLNPRCTQPNNPPSSQFCAACGQRLLLGDRYRAFQPLGKGSASRTLLAQDTSKLIDPRCVIKIFAMGGDGEGFRKQVVQLDRIFQHPQIASIYAYFERDNYHYLVQEFIPGKTLCTLLQEYGAFDELRIWKLLIDTLPILKCLHENWIIHRDIKPDNLIWRAYGSPHEQIVLVDLGTAKHTTESAMQKTGTILGSAEYVAPEQLLGRTVFASDLYSLGVTCLHLITGLSPFDLFNGIDDRWLWQSVSGPVSPALTDLLDRLCAKEVRSRYHTVDEVWVDVQSGWAQISGASPVGSLPLSPPPTVVRSLPPTASPPEAWSCVATFAVNTPVNAVVLSADGQTVFCGHSDRTVQIWTVETATCLDTLTEHRQAVTALALSPDGKTLASGGRDRTIYVWDLDQRRPRQVLSGHQGVITAIAFNQAGTQIFSASQDSHIHLWDVATGTLLFTFVGHQSAVTALALSPLAPVLVSGDRNGEVKVWHLKTQELLRSLAKHGEAVAAVAIAPLEPLQTPINPDRLVIISGSWDMSIRIRNLNTGGVYRSLSGHLLPVAAIALSPHQHQIVTASHDTTLKLWNLADGQLFTTLSGHTAPVSSVDYVNGTIASGSQDGTIKIWRSSLSIQPV